ALARARDDLRRAAEERLRALPARREAARLPQPHRRPRVGAVDEGPAAEGLLRERAARRDGGRHARSVRDLLRHDRRAGVCVGERRRLVGADRQPPAARAVRRSADDPMIRVVLPQHLRTLAGVDGEVLLAVDAPVTQASILDALEARYPMLRGTVRDHATKKRRPLVRFFACREDVTHEPPDARLPDAVATGDEPFMIVGAIAGG